MVLCGKVNKNLVATLNRAGGQAVGLCGLDGGMLKAVRRREDGVDYGLVGDVTEVDPKVIQDAIHNGFIPVISTVAQGVDEETVAHHGFSGGLRVGQGAECPLLQVDRRLGELLAVVGQAQLVQLIAAVAGGQEVGGHLGVEYEAGGGNALSQQSPAQVFYSVG